MHIVMLCFWSLVTKVGEDWIHFEKRTDDLTHDELGNDTNHLTNQLASLFQRRLENLTKFCNDYFGKGGTDWAGGEEMGYFILLL